MGYYRNNSPFGLAKGYKETGNMSMARITFLKALEFEPRFIWVKHQLMPDLLKEQVKMELISPFVFLMLPHTKKIHPGTGPLTFQRYHFSGQDRH
jgi:hypothetical protein